MRRELIAKTAVCKDQATAKMKEGANEFEIQLLEKDNDLEVIKEFCRWLVVEKEKVIKNIHIHLLPKGRDIDSIEDILKGSTGINYAKLTFEVGNFCGEIQGMGVGVIIHKYKVTLTDEGEVRYYYKMLNEYPSTFLLLENCMDFQKDKNSALIVEPINLFLDYVATVKRILKIYEDRIWALIDTTHLIADMRLHKKIQKMGIPLEIVSIIDVFSKRADIIKGVHLAYAYGCGSNLNQTGSFISKKKKHGIPFKGDSSAELILVNLIHCIERYLDADADIVLEVDEEDYLNPTNYGDIRNSYYRIVEKLAEGGGPGKEKRAFPRMQINVEANLEGSPVVIEDISINVEDTGAKSYYTLRILGEGLNLKANQIVRIIIEEETLEAEVLLDKEDCFVIKTYNKNTLRLVDRYYGFDDFVFENVI